MSNTTKAGKFLILDPEEHRSHGFQRPSALRYTRNKAFCPVIGQEITRLLPFHLLTFLNVGDRMHLVALLGLHPDENLYVTPEGAWRVNYVPAAFRAYPFDLAQRKVDGEIRGSLCFDLGSELYREAPDEQQGDVRFFDDDGSFAPEIKNALPFIGARASGQHSTQRAVQLIVEHGLLQPWSLPVENPTPDRPLIDNLYQVNQEKLRQIDGDTAKELTENSAMALAYAQLFSSSRAGLLLELYRQRYPNHAQSGTDPDSIDHLFGEGKSDIIQFNF